MLTSISQGCGFEHTELYDKAVDTDLFKEYLRVLARKNKRKKVVIFMDNLAVHKNAGVQELMRELKLECIWNVPYSPDYQPIETVFSQVKLLFKKEKLKALLTKGDFDQKQTIRNTFGSIKADYIDRCISRCVWLIRSIKT